MIAIEEVCFFSYLLKATGQPLRVAARVPKGMLVAGLTLLGPFFAMRRALQLQAAVPMVPRCQASSDDKSPSDGAKPHFCAPLLSPVFALT